MSQDAIITQASGSSLVGAQIFGRDCATPILNVVKKIDDEFVQNMPVFVNWWEDGKEVPAITGHHVKIKGTDGSDVCDSAVVSATMTSGNWVMPSMVDADFKTEKIQWLKLANEFCKMRNILPGRLNVFNTDGSFNYGSPYSFDFAKYALKSLAQAMAQTYTHSSMLGVAGNPYQANGFFTQLLSGWDVKGDGLDNLNVCQTIDWNDLTGTSDVDAPILASKTVTLFGEDYDAPEGYNLAQFIGYFYAPKVQREFARNYGGVTAWMMLTETGKSHGFLSSAACLQPCDLSSSLFDSELRGRFSRLLTTQFAQLYPFNLAFPVIETGFTPGTQEIWFGPRELGGRPTYGTYFAPIDELFGLAEPFGESYGYGFGMMMDEDPVVPDSAPFLSNEFEERTVQWSLTKLNMKCLEAAIQARYGTLVFGRHMWLRVTGVESPTLLKKAASNVSRDGVRLYGKGDNTLVISGWAAGVAKIVSGSDEITPTTAGNDLSTPTLRTELAGDINTFLAANGGGAATVSFDSGTGIATIVIANTPRVFDYLEDDAGTPKRYNFYTTN